MKRHGTQFFGWLVFGLGINCAVNTFYDDYDFNRKVTYLDLRVQILWLSLWIQIPIKKYAAKNEFKVVN